MADPELTLLSWRALAPAGAVSWYEREGRAIREDARSVGVDEARALDAAAVLSPAVQWEVLRARLRAFLADPEGTRMPGYGANVRKARAILRGQGRPTGPKVSAFARALAGDPSAVVVDRWAARAAGLPESGGARWYRELAGLYRRCAARRGEDPAAFQAAVWEAIRGPATPREDSRDSPGPAAEGAVG